jgi:hypothetical protein
MKQLESYIHHLPRALSADLCKTIIKEYEKDSKWQDATTAAQELYQSPFKTRICETLSISNPDSMGRSKVRKKIDSDLFETLHHLVGQYIEEDGECNVVSDSGYDLLRYNEGGYYNFHTDSGPGPIMRTLSAILNLSPADSYKGGQLEFRDGPLISMDEGDVILFPSNFCFPHRITPVTEGTRYSIVTWFA